MGKEFGLGGFTGLAIGAALGAGALYLFQNMGSFNIGFSKAPPAQASAGYMVQPDFDSGTGSPTWTTEEIGGATDIPEGSSGIWSFRDRKDRNDNVLFNKLPFIQLNAISEFNPSNLNFIGARDFDAKCTSLGNV